MTLVILKERKMSKDEIIKVEIEKVRNLSRIPISVFDSPLTRAASALIEEVDGTNKSFDILTEYYNGLCHKTLNDLYGTDIKKLSEFKYYQYFLPWIHTSPVTSFRDDAFITKIHSEAVMEKVIKMKNIISSIRQHGYSPERFRDRKLGHITGYFLKNQEKESFYIVSGNHRVAIMSALGVSEIPVIFERVGFFKSRDWENFGHKEISSVYDTRDSESWPGVKSGFISRDDAIKILEVFLTV